MRETRQIECFPSGRRGDGRTVKTANIVSTKAAGHDATNRKRSKQGSFQRLASRLVSISIIRLKMESG